MRTRETRPLFHFLRPVPPPPRLDFFIAAAAAAAAAVWGGLYVAGEKGGLYEKCMRPSSSSTSFPPLRPSLPPSSYPFCLNPISLRVEAKAKRGEGD